MSYALNSLIFVSACFLVFASVKKIVKMSRIRYLPLEPAFVRYSVKFSYVYMVSYIWFFVCLKFDYKFSSLT